MPEKTDAELIDVKPQPIDVETVPLAGLMPDERNANTGTARGGGMLEDSLQKYGAGRSVLLDKNGKLIAGNKTWEKAGQIGLEDVIVVRTDGTKLVAVQRMDLDLNTDVAARELAIADNAIGAASLEWSPDVLLSLANDGVDMTQFFKDDEWDDLMALLENSADDEKTPLKDNADPDNVPEAKEKRVKRGDLWSLGQHRLMCGDATSEMDMAVLMMSISEIMESLNGQGVGDGVTHKADMVFTDPPYNHASSDKLIAASQREGLPAPWGQGQNALQSSEWDKNFNISAALEALTQHLAENVSVYVCASHHTAGDVWAWMKSWAAHTSYCGWHKSNPMPSLSKRQWTWDMELICYATRGKHTFHFPDEGHALSTWDIPRASEKTGHPTEKPVALALHAIKHSSNQGNIVVDCFLGSGTTLMACHLSRRVCFGMEKSPAWCDVILTRFEQATGIAPERILEGAGEADEAAGATVEKTEPETTEEE